MLSLRPLHSESVRRAVGVCTLCALLLGTIGVPLPRVVSKDLSQAFPCQQSACGCMSAEACWRSCCCHTNREKVAWAKKHGVEVPAYVIAAAAKESSTGGASCCAVKVAKRKSCCETEKAPTKTKTTLTLVNLDNARKCQGQASLVLLLGQIVAEVREVEFDFLPEFCGLVTPVSLSAESFVADLPLQPPRAAFSPRA